MSLREDEELILITVLTQEIIGCLPPIKKLRVLLGVSLRCVPG